ncbi:MAG: nicotinate-nucleotide adenylyltransferase [Thermomicrobiales bacterium]
MVRSERIGIFGGTFDPVHVGHLIVAADLLQALSLDRVLFVPAGRPPHKDTSIISDDQDRLEMLHLAIDDNPMFQVSTIDLERDGPSYTADLLELLAGGHPNAQLVFLLGEDSLRDLPTWHDPNRIVRQAELGVARRPGVKLDLASVLDAVPAACGRITLVDSPLIGISSTDLRARVARGAPVAYQVPEQVERYIRHSGLYREP